MSATPHPFNTTTHFTVTAYVEPSVLPRVLGFFAQNNLIPVQVKSRVFKNGNMVIDIAITDMSDQSANVIAEKLRQLIPVDKVRMEHLLYTRHQAA